MKPQTIETIKMYLEPYGYEIKSGEHNNFYLVPNYNHFVHIEYMDGLFVLRMRDREVYSEDVQRVTEEMDEFNDIVRYLNAEIFRTGDKKEALLKWQQKIDKMGYGLNDYGKEKFWHLVCTYGFGSSTEGESECTRLFLWNHEHYTVVIDADLNKKVLNYHAGLYDENGTPIGKVESRLLAEKLKMKKLTKTECIFELEKGLGLSISIDEQKEGLHSRFVSLKKK